MSTISDLLKRQGFIILDGGLATELERHGCDLNSNLWSVEVLIKNPDLIRQVHLDYFLAGADIATTSSYQLSAPGLKDAGVAELDVSTLVTRSVKLAREARDEASAQQSDRDLLIAGSIGPYGAYLANGAEYRGDYGLTEEEFKAFHWPRMEALVQAGVDALAIETIPSLSETVALRDMLLEHDIPAWFSFTMRDSLHISDGTPLLNIVRMLDVEDQVVAIGVNCVPPETATEGLKTFSGHTRKPFIVYPNSGESYDASSKSWDHNKELKSDFATLAPTWFELGARFIGGCCRTTPDNIRKIRAALESKMTR